MRELSLHLLDIAENSVAAGARNVSITVREDLNADRLYLSVQDDGKGMDAATVARVTDPFVTSRTTRKVGLGLPLLKEAAELCNGYLRITSPPAPLPRAEREALLPSPLVGEGPGESFRGSMVGATGRSPLPSTLGKGTLVEVEFQHSNIDRMPLGDLGSTFLTLLISSSEIHWVFTYQVNQAVFYLDDAPIKAELEGVPFSEPVILTFLRELIANGVAGVG